MSAKPHVSYIDLSLRNGILHKYTKEKKTKQLQQMRT